MSLVSASAFRFPYRHCVLAIVLAGSAMGLSGCSDGTSTAAFVPTVDPNDNVPPPSSETMADFLRENVDYGTLLNLIEDADLALALQGDNEGMGWTLFAPSDNAFGNEAFESLEPAQRVSVMRRHLYSGRVAYAELVPGPLLMSEGSVEVAQNQDGILSVGGATIVARDRVVANGIIHFVDATLEPLQ